MGGERSLLGIDRAGGMTVFGHPEPIRALHADGVRIVMLTGDSRAAARATATELGIDEVEAEVALRPDGHRGEAAAGGAAG